MNKTEKVTTCNLSRRSFLQDSLAATAIATAGIGSAAVFSSSAAAGMSGGLITNNALSGWQSCIELHSQISQNLIARACGQHDQDGVVTNSPHFGFCPSCNTQISADYSAIRYRKENENA